MAVFLGTDGPDSLSGTTGDDLLAGGAGADTLVSTLGHDTLLGDEGNDLLRNVTFDAGGEQFEGGAGDDTIRVVGSGNLVIGGAGADLVELVDPSNASRQGTAVIHLGDLPAAGQPDADDGAVDVVRLSLQAINNGLVAPEIFGFRAGGGGDRLDLGSVLSSLFAFGHAGAHPFLDGGGLRLVQDGADAHLQADTVRVGSGPVWKDLAVLRNVDTTALTQDNFMPSVSPTGFAPGVTITGLDDAASGDFIGDASTLLRTGDGNDTVDGLAGNDTVDGGYLGNDFLAGGLGDDWILGLAGNDLLWGDARGDPFSGGADTVLGGDGDDLIFGGGGDDGNPDGRTYMHHGVVYQDRAGLMGEGGDDSIKGEAGNDILSGGEGNDFLDGGTGNDWLDGGAGRDNLRGGGGTDTLDGGEGDDVLSLLDFPSSGNVAFGGGGADQITSSGDGDTLEGGEGNDTLAAQGAGALMRGGAGDDALQALAAGVSLEGGDGSDTLVASGLQQRADGGAGDDTIAVHGAGVFAGGTGADLVRLLGTTSAGSIYLAALPDAATPDVVPTDTEVDVVEVGTAGADVYDFHPGSGGDVLDFAVLAQQLAPVSPGRVDLFASGRLQFAAAGADTLLQVRTGDSTPELPVFDTLLTLKNVEAAAITGDNLRNFVAETVDHPPLGALTVQGTLREGQTVTAFSELADADGFPADPAAIHFQWFADGVAIAGATGRTLTLAEADVGHTLSVQASYTDLAGNENAFLGAPSAPVENVNSLPTGGIALQGAVAIGQPLTVLDTLQDEDGLGVVRYQWLADGVATGVEGGSFTPGKDHLGQAVQVLASYTDAHGTPESVASAASEVLAGGVHGRVYQWKTHALVAGVQVAASDGTTDTTSPNGVYQLAATPAGAFTLAASASSVPGTAAAITSADALAALRIAVGSSPNPDPDGTGPLPAPTLSPYQVIAADVNGDGRVSSADALAILRMAVKAPAAIVPTWEFVGEKTDLWNEAQGASALTRGAADWNALPAPTLQGAGEAGFVAVLRGDVNGSWAGPAGTPDLDVLEPAHIAQLAATLGVPMEVWGM